MTYFPEGALWTVVAEASSQEPDMIQNDLRNLKADKGSPVASANLIPNEIMAIGDRGFHYVTYNMTGTFLLPCRI